MRRRTKAKAIDPGQFDRDSLIPRAMAVQLIAQTVRRDGDTDRQARDRVSQRIIYHVAKRKLSRMACGNFVFGELAAWAQDSWPSVPMDWAPTRTSTGKVQVTLDGVTCEFTGCHVPLDLPKCQNQVIELFREVTALRRENASLRQELAEPRRLKVRDQKYLEEARKIGGTGGRGHAK